jgi:hypothetical protein
MSVLFATPFFLATPTRQKAAARLRPSNQPTRRNRTTTGTSARWQAQQEAMSVFFRRSHLRGPTTHATPTIHPRP